MKHNSNLTLIFLTLIYLIGISEYSRGQVPCSITKTSIDSLYWEYQPEFEKYSSSFENCNLERSETISIALMKAASHWDGNRYEFLANELRSLGQDSIEMSAEQFGIYLTLTGMQLLDQSDFDRARKNLDAGAKVLQSGNLGNSSWFLRNRITRVRLAAWENTTETGDSILSTISPNFDYKNRHPIGLNCEYLLTKAFLEGKTTGATASIKTNFTARDLIIDKPQLYPYLGQALYGIGQGYITKFQFDTALHYLDSSALVYQFHQDTMHLTYSNIRDQIGVVYYYQGAYQKALPNMLTAFTIVEKIFDESHEAYGSLTSNLSVVYEKLGQFEKSLEYIQKSLVNTELLFGSRHPLYLTSLNNYGLTLTRLERYPEAKKAFYQIIKTMDEDSLSSSTKYGLYLDNLGRVFLKTNRLDSAEYCYTKAVENAFQNHGKEHYYYIIRRNNLASLYSRQGRVYEALEIYESLIEPTKVVFGTLHPQYGIRLSNLASAYEEIGDYKKASSYYSASAENLIDQFYNYYPSLSEENKIEYLDLQRDWIDRLFSFCVHGDGFDINPHLQTLHLAVKGLALDSHVTIRESNGNEELREKWKDLRRQIGDLSRKPNGDQLRDSLNMLVSEAEKIEIELLAKYPYDFHLKKLNHEDIRQKLDTGEVAVDFFHFQFMKDIDYTDTILYGAFLNKKEWENPKILIIGSEDSLAAAIQKFHLTGSTMGLNKLIWQPLLPYLESVIHISPTGILNKVPFHLLEDSNGKISLKKHKLHYYQNFRDLINRTDHRLKIESIALFGNPDFDHSPEKLVEDTSMALGIKDLLVQNLRTLLVDSIRGMSTFTRLPGTAKELQEIGQIAESHNWQSKIYQDTAANEVNFKNLNRSSSSIVHLATHGFFLEKLINISEEKPAEKDILLTSENPMLRSGLALAGINKIWQQDRLAPPEEDGILTSYEISNLDFFNTELVVLSACETGLGDLKNSEGVYGLQRAFRQAGAKNLIISLWKIPDFQTAELMGIFYKKLANYHDAHLALKEAQLELSEKYPPKFWAGFILIE